MSGPTWPPASHPGASTATTCRAGGGTDIGAPRTPGQNRAAFDAWSQRHGLYQAYPEAAYERVVEAAGLAPAADGLRVLEVGCGSGAFAARMSHPGRAVAGIEISRELLGAARDLQLAAPLLLFEGDATRLPFRDAAFDAVFAGDFLHHIPDLLPAAVREYARVLRPHGRFVAFEPNAAEPYTRWFYRLGFAEVPTERAVDPLALRSLLESGGFAQVAMRPLPVAAAGGNGEPAWRRALHRHGALAFAGKAARYGTLLLLAGVERLRPARLPNPALARAPHVLVTAVRGA